MGTLTRILGVVAIAGALTAISGYANKNQTLFALGATGLTLGGVGYILTKENKLDY